MNTTSDTSLMLFYTISRPFFFVYLPNSTFDFIPKVQFAQKQRSFYRVCHIHIYSENEETNRGQVRNRVCDAIEVTPRMFVLSKHVRPSRRTRNAECIILISENVVVVAQSRGQSTYGQKYIQH